MRDKVVGSRQEYSFKTRSYERIYNYKKKTYEPYNVWKFKKWVSSGYWGTEEVWSRCAYKETVPDGYRTTYLSNRWYSTYKSDTSTIDYRYVRKRTTYSLEYGSRTEYNYDLYKKTPKYREDCHGGFVENKIWVDDSHWEKSGWTESWRGSPWVKYAEETRSRETGYVVFNSSKAPRSGVHPDFGYAYINYDDVYGGWGNWSSYSPTVRTKSHIVDVRTRTTYRKRPFAIETFNETKSTSDNYLYLNSFSENVSYTYFEKEKRYFKNEVINRENAIKVEVNSSEWNEALNQGYTSFEPSGDDKVCYTRYTKGDLVLQKAGMRDRFIKKLLNDKVRPVIRLEDSDGLVFLDKYIYVPLGHGLSLPRCIVDDNLQDDLQCNISGIPDDVTKFGEHLVTFSARDMAGNEAEPINITVVTADTTPPFIRLLGDVNYIREVQKYKDGLEVEYESNAFLSIYIDGDFVGTQISDLRNHPSLSRIGNYTVSYVVKDGSLNENSVIRYVSIVENNPPSLYVIGPQTYFIDSGHSYIEFGAQCVDTLGNDCSSSITKEYFRNGDAGRERLESEQEISVTPGKYIVSYTGMDSRKVEATIERSVEVDNYISLNGGSKLVPTKSHINLPNCKFVTKDGDIACELPNFDSPSAEGDYTVEYIVAYDSDGDGVNDHDYNRTWSFTIRNEAPVINLDYGDNDQGDKIVIKKGESFQLPECDVQDDYFDDLSCELSGYLVGTSVEGTYDIYYKVSDRYGKSASRKVELIITDNADSYGLYYTKQMVTKYIFRGGSDSLLSIGRYVDEHGDLLSAVREDMANHFENIVRVGKGTTDKIRPVQMFSDYTMDRYISHCEDSYVSLTAVLGNELLIKQGKDFDSLTASERNELISFMGAMSTYDIVARNKLFDFHAVESIKWGIDFSWGIKVD